MNHLMPDEPDHQSRNLLHLLREFNAVSSDLQIEMSKVLIADPANHKHLQKQLSQSENQMETILDNATMGFVAVMPLATMNRCNLFARALGMHTTLTGNPAVHEALDIINEEVLESICNEHS